LTTYQVAVLVGSLRRESINRKLAQALTRLAPPTLELYMVPLEQLPMYNGDLEGNRPEAVNRFVAECARADAILFVTPEYNRSLPAVLKNAIDWGSKPMDKNVWRDKPVASSGTSPGGIGTCAAQLHLRQVMGAVSASFVGGEAYITMKPGLIADDGTVTDESTRNFLKAYLERFAGFVAKLARK
jgi:chromate reductase